MSKSESNITLRISYWDGQYDEVFQNDRLKCGI